MAYRDKSQGFAFVYVDIHKLLASQKSMQVEAMPPNPNMVNMNRDPQAPMKEEEESVRPVKLPLDQFTAIQPELTQKSSADVKDRGEAIEQVKKNLDRLQNLHHKLHTVLDDLNQVNRWKKKKKD